MANMNETDKTDAGFYSIFNMVMINGSASHIHKVFNATVNNMTKQGNNTAFDGTVSITMKMVQLIMSLPESPLPITTQLLFQWIHLK